ncbi:type IV secretion system protein VirB4 [Shouchella sp. 1P09AA]|uniref:VirB4 family type IV secretion system protein n=1 Tax=unclassified Shouchella TaxID=2893065 RepID=UPI0039A07B61
MLATILDMIRPKEKEKEEVNAGYNPYLLSQIQPQGGIKFEESYIKKGDGYEVSIHIYDFQTVVSDFWLEEIMNMPEVVACLDVGTPNNLQIQSSLNKSMAEEQNRGETAKDTSDFLEAVENYNDLKEIYNEIRQGEVIKRMVLRLYVASQTIDSLELKVKKIMDDLASLNFRGSVFLNEQEYEWESLFKPYSAQLKYSNKRKGVEIPALSIAGGLPFHYTSLDDPYGTHYGTTDTNGNVLFDMFHQDAKRKFYNAVMIGKMGSGKSTMLKKVALDNAIKGNKIRVLDVTGEFTELANKLDGKVIALDGTNGSINPLHVYKSDTDDSGNVREETSFTQHLSKLSVFYRFLAPEVSNEEIKEYENLLRKLYVEHGLWVEEREANVITDLKANQYPIFSDLLKLLQDELYENIEKQKVNEDISVNKRTRLENIELNIANVVKNYGHLFNTHSTIDDFNNEDFVSFPLRNLSELKPEIFQAQLFNVLNKLWDGMLSNGQPQLKALTKHRLTQPEARKYLILIDEAHHIINTRKSSEHAVLYLQRFMREARKYFGGLFFASHVIEDFVPNNASESSAEEVKKLFSLTQYKFIAEQDSESLAKLKSVFTGQLNESELSQIPYLEKGQVILSISSVKNVKMNVDVSDEELDLFGGGA